MKILNQVKDKVMSNPKLLIGATTMAVACTNVFAEGETTGSAVSALDLSGVDFGIVLATVTGVIAIGVVPMLSIAAAKKGIGLLMSLVKKA